jgi:hypothetical protein
VGLDRRADIAEPRTRPNLADTEPHAFEGDVDQALRLDARLAHIEHAAAVAVITILDHGDVHIEDVACLEHALTGHAMADLMVDRGADGLGERAVPGRRIVERRGHGFLDPDHMVVAKVIELARGDTRAHVGRDEVEHFGSQAPGDAHALHLFRALQDYGHSTDYARILG